MNPLLTVSLFVANVLALSFTLSVLLLAFWQHPGDKIGRAVMQFLAAVALQNLSALLLMAILAFNGPTVLLTIVTNLSVMSFGLSTLSAFSLIASLAGLMKQRYQVLARAGMILFLLMLVPLWSGAFFAEGAPIEQMAIFATAGTVFALTALGYIILTLLTIVYYRRRLDLVIGVGVVVLLLAQILVIFNIRLREIGFASLVSVVASAFLAYRLIRMQLFNPLLMHMAQFTALRDVSRALISPRDEQEALDAIAQQTRRLLNTDLALVLVRDESQQAHVVSAQDGWTTSLIGRKLPLGGGLSGRVFQEKQTIRLPNYHVWEGRSPAFEDVPINAALSVPLLYDNAVVGVLTAGELKPGRLFGERDQALLEMLAPQAAVAIINARLREQVAALPPPGSQLI